MISQEKPHLSVEPVARKPKVKALVVHGSYAVLGGAESYSIRIVSLLQRRFDRIVVLHSSAPPNLEAMERFSGFSLDREKIEFRSVQPPPLLATLLNGRPGLTLLRYAFVVREARRQARNFDLVASTFGECPVAGAPALYTMHIPLLVADRESLAFCGIPDRGTLRRAFHGVYISVVKMVMGFRRADLERPLTIANSEWTAGQVRRHYPSANVKALYQGARVGVSPASAGWKEFDERQNSFVFLGRLTPAKRLEDAIGIVRGVREAGFPVGLTLIGGAESPEWVQDLIAPYDWIVWKRNLGRDEVEAVAATHRWGLHCYRFEHYGLAPAELQALGCITFVHDSGGQREIITNPAQRYVDCDDAVQKVTAMMRSDSLQSQALEIAKASAMMHRPSDFDMAFNHEVARLVAS